MNYYRYVCLEWLMPGFSEMRKGYAAGYPRNSFDPDPGRI
jgi:hypothetical protein